MRINLFKMYTFLTYTNFPGVDSDDSVKDPNYGSSSRCTDSTSSYLELDDIAQTGSAPEELQSATSPLIVEGEISRNPLNEVTNTRKRKKRTQNWIRMKAKRLRNTDLIKFDIREHINCIPTIDSHYCRSNTSKRYIDGGRSLAQYYRDYVNDSKKQNKPFAHYLTYHHIFNNEFNIAFHSPKKDLCDTCVAFNNAVGDAKENLKANYDKHLAEKDQSRKEKEVDKNRLDNVVVDVYDLQAVLPCPRGDVSNFYYLSKLNVLNFTIYNLKSKEVECYAWHEGDGNRGVNEIATCVWKYLDKLSHNAVEPFHVVFYSDNCCGQQKNKFMIYTYLLALTKFPKILSITHKFLIKGHSANEGDSAHSLIERRIKASLKSNPIYSPDHYYYLIRSAKVNGKPFILNELSHDSFFDIKTATDKIGKSLPPKNTVNEPFKVTDIRIVKVSTENKDTIFYKTSYFDTDFKEIKLFSATRRNKPDLNNINFEQLYEEKIKISDQKKGFINLIEKNIIPQYYRTFYENL
ncbi:unnamed protein product [Euphydryas editha]|uniref:DUF7869 domain-containing protein n=1 Tax=Euphydryas editha TaxID=104508 RepID=A0AAU9U473_EUPED|nr:unnamed protein product [Euphydryas editha]